MCTSLYSCCKSFCKPSAAAAADAEKVEALVRKGAAGGHATVAAETADARSDNHKRFMSFKMARDTNTSNIFVETHTRGILRKIDEHALAIYTP